VDFAWRNGKEYGGTNAAGMIMSVLANRVKAGWGTWIEVLDSAPKYAAAPLVTEGRPSLWDPVFVQLLHDVQVFYAGTKNMALSMPPKNLGYVIPPQPAMYWADSRRIQSAFFINKIQYNPEHPRIGEMGTLALYA